MKKQSLDWNADGTIMSAKYGNGAVLECDTGKLPANIWAPCALARHGLAQKIGDAKSGGTAAEKFAEATEIWASLCNGEFNRRGREGIDLMPFVWELLAKGDAKLAGRWAAEYAKLTDEEQAKVRAKPGVKAALDRVRADRRLAGQTTGDKPFDPMA